ncbi:MAG TPA: signal peptidase I [Blastocatellia bacterium]|nr:signal peptidase I [Blastocatellia bacterium]
MTEEPRIIIPEIGRNSGEEEAGEPAQAVPALPPELMPEVRPVYVPPPKSLVREYFEMGIVTIIQLLFLWTFIAQGMMVPTGSMQNTINIGDRFFANKFIFGRNTPVVGALLPAREIKRGDVIIFKYPKDPKINYVKRVIGLPGDEVLVRGTRVFVNGQELPEQRVTIRQESNYSALPEVAEEAAPPEATYRVYYEERAAEGPNSEPHRAKAGIGEATQVPEDCYFVMGDNRDNSEDSRFWGFVPRDNIIGHALYVHWSFNARDPEALQSGNLLSRLLGRTQWRRIGKPIK